MGLLEKEELITLASQIKPVVRFNYRGDVADTQTGLNGNYPLCFIQETDVVHNFYTLNAYEQEKATGLTFLQIIPVSSMSVNYGYARPTVQEILSAIPVENRDSTVAFEYLYPDAFNVMSYPRLSQHDGLAALYGGKLPDSIARRSVIVGGEYHNPVIRKVASHQSSIVADAAKRFLQNSR